MVPAAASSRAAAGRRQTAGGQRLANGGRCCHLPRFAERQSVAQAPPCGQRRSPARHHGLTISGTASACGAADRTSRQGRSPRQADGVGHRPAIGNPSSAKVRRSSPSSGTAASGPAAFRGTEPRVPSGRSGLLAEVPRRRRVFPPRAGHRRCSPRYGRQGARSPGRRPRAAPDAVSAAQRWTRRLRGRTLVSRQCPQGENNRKQCRLPDVPGAHASVVTPVSRGPCPGGPRADRTGRARPGGSRRRRPGSRWRN